MHLLITITAVLILAMGVFVSQKQKSKIEPSIPKEEVLSEEDQNQVDDVSQTLTPKPTKPPPSISVSQSTLRDDYKYPNSTIVSASAKNLSLQSQDNSDTITNWYKAKILSEGMNIKTFVTTKANDKVLNKLTGAKVDKEISVEIRKEPGEQIVYITIEVDMD